MFFVEEFYLFKRYPSKPQYSTIQCNLFDDLITTMKKKAIVFPCKLTYYHELALRSFDLFFHQVFGGGK